MATDPTADFTPIEELFLAFCWERRLWRIVNLPDLCCDDCGTEFPNTEMGREALYSHACQPILPYR